MTYSGSKALLHSQAWLTKRYRTQKRTAEQISKELDVPIIQVYRYLDKFGLRKKK